MVESEGIFRRNPTEVSLEAEHGSYEMLRTAAEQELVTLLEGAVFENEDEELLLTEWNTLLQSRVADAIHNRGKIDPAALGTELQVFARQLYLRRHPDAIELKKKRAGAQGDAEAAKELLLELRAARRGKIEELRGKIDRLYAGKDRNDLVEACCALMEEEIGSLRANGDEHAASTVSASLEVVREMGKKEPRKKDIIENPLEQVKHAAHTLVASLVIRGRVGPGDVRFAERLATRLIQGIPGYLADEEGLERAVLTEISGRNRGTMPNVRHIDEKRAFVDPA